MVGNFLSLNNTSASPTASNLSEIRTISTRPATGQIYSFYPPVPILTYSWTGPGLSNPAIQNPIVSAPNGTIVYTVSVDNSGCSSTATVSVTAGTPLTCSAATLSSASVCAGTAFTVTANHAGGGGPFHYSWNDNGLGAGPYADAQSITLTTNTLGNYQFDVTVSDSCGNSCVSTVNSGIIADCGVTLTSNIFLEGYYIGGGEMNTFLYNYDSGLPSPNPLINSVMTDTVYISAMDSIDFSHALVDQQTGILKKNGDVTVTFSPAVAAGHQYYIKVNHHNHVETWSATPVLLTGSTTYNFLSAQSQAYARNQALTFDALYAAMYAGDFNQDGAVDGSDFLLFDPDNQNALGGYENSDVNGDGAVDGSDFLLYDPNNQNAIGAAVPNP